MISVNCQQCGKIFEAKRKSAKFCSDLCRVNFNNGKPITQEEKKFPDWLTPLDGGKDRPSGFAIDVELAPNWFLDYVSQHKSLVDFDVERYCTEIGLNPNELIPDHKKLREENKRLNLAKMGQVNEREKTGAAITGVAEDINIRKNVKTYNAFDNPAFKSKMGIK